MNLPLYEFSPAQDAWRKLVAPVLAAKKEREEANACLLSLAKPQPQL